MDGFLNLDKPPGMTSFDVIRALRRQLRGTKMGHLGTLDPMATGVLPVALGRATRLIPLLEDTGKTYVARARFGGTSDTEDAWGNITWGKGPAELIPEELDAILAEFSGVIEQVPPMYSAVHHQGKRLYELAREGKTVEVAPRKVTIKELRLLDLGRDEDSWWADLFIECSRGTYIRTLIKDIGDKMGYGAFMAALRRTKAGPFFIEDSVRLEDVNPERDVLSPDFPFRDWPAVAVGAAQSKRIGNGNVTELPDEVPYSQLEGRIRVFDNQGRLLALGTVDRSGESAVIRTIRILSGNDASGNDIEKATRVYEE